MLSLIGKRMLQAISFTIVRDGRKGDEAIIDEQDDIRPLMSDDTSLAMIEALGVFRM